MFQYGGWYADVDYVIINSLKDLKNVFSSVGAHKQTKNLWLTNSVFNMEHPENRIARFYLERVKENFKGVQRTEIGPMFLTETFRMFCNLTNDFQFSTMSGTIDKQK